MDVQAPRESGRNAGLRRHGLIQVIAALAAAALLAPPAGAERVSDIPGAFADVGIGAGEMGMGGAVVAGVEGASAVFWNPAGLARSERSREFAVTYCDQMGLVPYSAASGLFQLGDRYALGAGVVYSGDDALSETTVLVSLARRLPDAPWEKERPVTAGATVRTRWASFGNNESTHAQVTGSAFGLAVDVGAIVPVPGGLSLGVSARDVAGVLSWDSSARGTYDEGVPATLTLAVGSTPWHDLSVEVDLEKALHLDRRDMVLAGAELRLFRVAAIRGGYRRALPPGDLEEFSVGAGATVTAGTTAISVDVTYLLGHVDDTLRLGVAFGT